MSPAGDGGSAGQGPSSTELLGLSGLLAAAVVVPLLLGIAVDGATHRAPIFFFIGLIVGVLAAVATVYTRFKRYL
jgi:F0F1-type ATP synthase assembly protein I